jgi:hypothetical protein
VKHVSTVVMYYCFTSDSKFKNGIYLGTPAIMSKLCTGVGTIRGNDKDRGRRCQSCHDLRKKRGSSNTGTFLNKWYLKFLQGIERRKKPTLCITDCNNAESLIKVNDELLTESGKQLKEEAESQVEYYKHIANLPEGIKSKLHYEVEAPGGVPCDSSFLKDAADLYESNPVFRDSLVIGLLKAAVNRTKGMGNAEMDEKVINFYRFVATYSPKAATIVSANLQGPGKRWMQRLNARDRSSCILEDEHNIIVNRMKNAMATRAIDDKTPVTFSLAIDATKVAKVLEVSSTYKAIIGGTHPNHMVSVNDLSEDDIAAILNGTSKSISIEDATEVKVAIMSLQTTRGGVSPSVIVAARPQSNNESSDFIQAMEHAASCAAENKTCFTGFAVDGVSVESEDVRRSICDFLSCKIDHVGSTDTNHNMKSWRYQIVGGSCAVTIGTCVLDADLLRLSGISADLWRPVDFASDLLVLKLASHATVQSLYSYHISGDETETVNDFSAGDIGSLMVTFVMTKLRLHSINSRNVDAKQRAVFSWMSMLWFTSLSGACVVTKRNLVAEAIAFSFLLLRSDVKKPRNLTSEPAEHEFGNYRTKDREFSTLGVCHLAENNERRSRMMFLSNLIPTRDAQKGYQATHSDWVAYNKICASMLEGGPVLISADGGAVAAQLWSTVRAVIGRASNLMKPFFQFLGVTDEEISPFCRDFTSLDNLCDALIAYSPSTFSYEGSVGLGEKDNDVEINSDDGITPKVIANKMCDLVNDLLGPSGTDNLADSASEENGGTDNAATATTNGDKSRQ